MRRAGGLLWGVLARAVGAVGVGVTTGELGRVVAGEIERVGAEGVAQEVGFPACCSICVNEEAVHGVPGVRVLREGDVVTIDVAMRVGGRGEHRDRRTDLGGTARGWCVDAARAVVVGEGTEERRRLVAAARGAVEAVVAAMGPGRWWSEAAGEAERVARGAGCRVVGEYAGHGIGRGLHEGPACPFVFGDSGRGGGGGLDFVLRPGMVLTVEPVLALGLSVGGEGGAGVIGLDDGWTVVTADRSAAAHEERTVAVTRRGAEVLTA